MFWQSVVNSLALVLHWQMYAPVLVYVIISKIPGIVIGFIVDEEDELSKRHVLLITIIENIIHVFALFVTVGTLFPMMTGVDGVTWSLPWEILGAAPVGTLTMFFILTIVSLVIPILCRSNNAITFFAGYFIKIILGLVIVSFLARTINDIHPEFGIQNIELIPGIGMIVGLIISSGASLGLVIVMSIVIGMPLLMVNFFLSETVKATLGAAFGLIPVFMYGAFIGLQIYG